MIAHKKQRTTDNGQRTRDAAVRRGVTLVEMLVTVAILVLIMAVVAQVFQAATGAVSTAQAIQDLDGQLRRLESMIRSDLGGATAKFTPAPLYPMGPFGLDPLQNLGYFEYGENEFADSQGEDGDDYLKFTAKAPVGRPFTGRIFLPPPQPINGNPALSQAQIAQYLASQPITITSEYAEIIYFLRNGNLYRRVLLIAPERQSTITPAVNNSGLDQNGAQFPFQPSAIVGSNSQWPAVGNVPFLSWQGVNDLSARPASRGNAAGQTIRLNTLGDLTNRENRFAAPRFADDFLTLGPPQVAGGGPTWTPGPDGLYDDVNDDNVPDLYPSLYPGVFNAGLIFAPSYTPNNTAINLLAFPYIFPGAYSQPQNLANGYQLGWIHSPNPSVSNPATTFDGPQGPLLYLQNMNHNPLDVGDNLPQPSLNSEYQTWWGFPTWREMLSPVWNDPSVQVNVALAQPNGLTPLPANVVPVVDNGNFLPAMSATWRGNPQLYTDGIGTANQFFPNPENNAQQQQLWQLWSALSWEDDLIMTNVRSFDVKAYDNALANYADLGWGDDPRTSGFNNAPFLGGNPDLSGKNVNPPLVQIQGQWWDYINFTFAHEGRMPPLTTDQRFDAQFGAATYSLPANNTYTGNIGDNDANNVGVVRMRRVWDSWSTEYSKAPAQGQNVNLNAFPWGPPFSPPIYPSYPPPYPAQLRAIQIQIRVADPTNQHVKSLTLRQDFTEKL
jgi:prepilin-type N-terminal cleavage/methylation domain-containing protein